MPRRFAGHPTNPRDKSEQGPVRQVPLRASILVVSPDAAPEVAFGGVALAAVVLIALGLHGHELKVPPSDASGAPRQQHST